MTYEVTTRDKNMDAAVAGIAAITNISVELIRGFFGIIQIMAQASMSNGLVGGAMILWINGFFSSFKDSHGEPLFTKAILDSVTAIVLISFGVSTIGELAAIITGAKATDAAKPSMTTGVFGGGSSDLSAMIPLITKALAVV